MQSFGCGGVSKSPCARQPRKCSMRWPNWMMPKNSSGLRKRRCPFARSTFPSQRFENDSCAQARKDGGLMSLFGAGRSQETAFMTTPTKQVPPLDLKRFQYDIAPRRSPADPLRHKRSMDWAERFQLAPSESARKLIDKIHVDDMSAAICVDASPEVLDLCTDLLLWFFVSDDQYDERAIGAHPLKMEKVFGNFCGFW